MSKMGSYGYPLSSVQAYRHTLVLDSHFNFIAQCYGHGFPASYLLLHNSLQRSRLFKLIFILSSKRMCINVPEVLSITSGADSCH